MQEVEVHDDLTYVIWLNLDYWTIIPRAHLHTYTATFLHNSSYKNIVIG